MRRILKTVVHPAVFIPLVLGVATLAMLLTLADARKVIADALGFQRSYLLYFLLLMGVYFVLRGVQWHYLLRSLGIRAPVRSQVFAFSLGEIAKSLPIGNYFQNYLLLESQGTRFGLSSVATTLILVTEVVVSLAAVLLFGLGGWSGWVRPLIIAGIVVAGLTVALLYAFRTVARVPAWLERRAAVRRVLAEVAHYRAGARTLRRPRVLVVETLLSAAYLSTAALGLYCIVRGFGIDGISVWQAAAVYFFSLAIGLIVPIPVDFGLIEVSGAGALVAFGVDKSAAVAVMLVNRLLSIVCSTAFAVAVALVLHREAVATLRRRRVPVPVPAQSVPPRNRERSVRARRIRLYTHAPRISRMRPLAKRETAPAGQS